MPIRPLPEEIGYGWVSTEVLPTHPGYDYRAEGRYHNYYLREGSSYPDILGGPTDGSPGSALRVDVFSPNLNKHLHLGHLKNLVVGVAVCNLVRGRAVSLLGTSQGEIPWAMENLQAWLGMTGLFNPGTWVPCRDVELPPPSGLIPGSGDQAGCLVWHGPEGPVIATRSDGRMTYAGYELAFREHRGGADIYVVGEEQKSHFAALGLQDKHWVVGPILGEDGTKMSSRTGNVIGAAEALAAVRRGLKGEHTQQLAWNCLAWQFLRGKARQTTQWNPATSESSGGLWVHYTLDRVSKALATGNHGDVRAEPLDLVRLRALTMYTEWEIQEARTHKEACRVISRVERLCGELANWYGKYYFQRLGRSSLEVLQAGIDTCRHALSAVGLKYVSTGGYT